MYLCVSCSIDGGVVDVSLGVSIRRLMIASSQISARLIAIVPN